MIPSALDFVRNYVSIFALSFRVRQYEIAMSNRFSERLNERTRIARNPHDTMAQTIQGSKMVAEQTRENVSDVFKTQNLLSQLCDWLNRVTLERGTALESLHAMEAKDSMAALRGIFEDCRENYDIDFSLNVSTPGGDMAFL